MVHSHIVGVFMPHLNYILGLRMDMLSAPEFKSVFVCCCFAHASNKSSKD